MKKILIILLFIALPVITIIISQPKAEIISLDNWALARKEDIADSILWIHNWAKVESVITNNLRIWAEADSVNINDLRLWSELDSVNINDLRIWAEADSVNLDNLRIWAESDSININDIRIWAEADSVEINLLRIWSEADSINIDDLRIWAETDSSTYNAILANAKAAISDSLGTLFTHPNAETVTAVPDTLAADVFAPGNFRVYMDTAGVFTIEEL